MTAAGTLYRTDPEYRKRGGLPYTYAEVISKSDTVDCVQTCRAIYVGGTGHVNLVTLDGQTVLFSAVPVGTIIPISFTRVMSASTTATLMIGLA